MISIKVDNKKFLYQVIIFVFLSNLIVYLLSSSKEQPPENHFDFKEYQSVVAKLRLYVPFESMKKIELWDPTEKILLKDVYLIKELNDESGLKESGSGYIIKIHQKNLSQYMKLKNNFLDAYPTGSTPNTNKHKKRQYYEMVF